MVFEEESWVLMWFPPDVGMRTKTFKTRESVDIFLRGQVYDYDVPYPAGDWNPALTHRVTTIEEEVVEL